MLTRVAVDLLAGHDAHSTLILDFSQNRQKDLGFSSESSQFFLLKFQHFFLDGILIELEGLAVLGLDIDYIVIIESGFVDAAHRMQEIADF